MQGMLEPTNENNLINTERLDSLGDLIKNFKNIIKGTHLQQKRFLLYNGKLATEDHHIKSIEIKISYIHQSGREFIILIIRDTTQRDLLITLEDNNKYKDQLLASVSHELRAPLTPCGQNISIFGSEYFFRDFKIKIRGLLSPFQFYQRKGVLQKNLFGTNHDSLRIKVKSL